MLGLNYVPKILKLDVSGMPLEWITLEEAVMYYAKDMVIFELGNPVTTFRGGYNRVTNLQSEITANSIIGVKGFPDKKMAKPSTPKLTNESLFERDRHVCAYCGESFHSNHLTREHIVPRWMNGPDDWMNVVTACKDCNNSKGGKTLEESKMTLLYSPYVPDRYEDFILRQGTRTILADQMEFLLRKVNKNSRLKFN
jgi:hypothetical protein